MDELKEYLKGKYFVDNDDPEVSDMYEAVKGCLSDFQNKFNELKQCGLKINKIMPVGSMSEGTGIWLDKYNRQQWRGDKEIPNGSGMVLPEEYSCIEFDFLALLEPLTADMETVPTCPGHAKLRSNLFKDELTINQLRETDETDGNSDSGDPCDQWEFENIFQKPYKIITREFYQSILIVGESDYFRREIETGSCILEFVESFDAPVLFIWISKVAKIKVIAGKMDFLPAFKTTHLQHDTYIVAKRCCNPIIQCSNSPSCYSDCPQQCWRVSQSREETGHIRQTVVHHRDLYRIIKVFCDKVSKHHYLSSKIIEPDCSHCFKVPTSYHIKTALIHHIKACEESTANMTKCFHQTLLLLIEYTYKGQILNWKGTFYLPIEAYEPYFCSVMWLVFGQFDLESSRSQRDTAECLDIFELPTNIKNMAVDLSCAATEKLPWESFERILENILIYPVWDYAMFALPLSPDLTTQGRCDILLETRAKVYYCTGSEQETKTLESEEDVEPVVQRSHSESDFSHLADYLDDKNFEKNWEDIFLRLKENNMFIFGSFAQHVKNQQREFHVHEVPVNSPWDSEEKGFIISAIKEENHFWFNRMQEGFEWFSSAFDSNMELK